MYVMSTVRYLSKVLIMSHRDTSVIFMIEHITRELPVCLIGALRVSRICLNVVAPNNTSLRHMHRANQQSNFDL